MNTFTCNSASPVEQSLADYERRQDAQNDESVYELHRVLNGIADYFRSRVLTRAGRIPNEEVAIMDRFAELASDEFEQDFCETLLRVAATDYYRAGELLSQLTKKISLIIAKEFREELEPEARDRGYIQEGA